VNVPTRASGRWPYFALSFAHLVVTQCPAKASQHGFFHNSVKLGWESADEMIENPCAFMPESSTTQPVPVATDYIVVVSNEDDFHAGFHHFAEKVNRKLRAGYQLHGQPFSINQTLCQAMVKYENTTGGGNATVYFNHPGNVNPL
jgi:hypothetical protein